MEEDFIVDMPIYLMKRKRELEKQIKELMSSGVRVIRSGDALVDTIPKDMTENAKKNAIKIAEEYLKVLGELKK